MFIGCLLKEDVVIFVLKTRGYYMMSFLKGLFKRKLVLGIFLCVAGFSAFFFFRGSGKTAPDQYLLAKVAKENLITSVSGSGQVAGEREIGLSAEVNGKVTKVFVKQGDPLKAGDPIAQIDNTDAVKSVRDAERNVRDAQLSLESAKLSYNKLFEKDATQILQAEHRVNSAERSLSDLLDGSDAINITQAEQEVQLKKEDVKMSEDGVTPSLVRDAYDDAAATILDIAQTAEDALRDADKALGIDSPSFSEGYDRQKSGLNSSALALAITDYATAKDYVKAFSKTVDGIARSGASLILIDSTMDEADVMLRELGDLMDSAYDVTINTVASANLTQSSLDSVRSTVRSARTSVRSAQTSLSTQQKAIDDAHTSFETAKINLAKAESTLEDLRVGATENEIAASRESLAEAQAALKDLQADPNSADIASAKLSLSQKEASLESARDALSDAQDSLSDYTLVAPIDGVIANVSVYEKDTVSPSTAIATLLTESMIANVTLNEVDIASIKVGQKATITFDAIEDLSVAGTVVTVDMIGSASQGVVGYGVKIAFLTNDERVKSGMSASVAIITDAKTDILAVPNAAVETSGNTDTVSVLSGTFDEVVATTVGIPGMPEYREVTIGASNDEWTEITGGLKEGEYVVIKTISGSAQSSSSAKTASSSGGAASVFGGMGGGAMGGTMRGSFPRD